MPAVNDLHVFGPVANCKCTLMANVIAFADSGYVEVALRFFLVIILIRPTSVEASRGAVARGVTVKATGCGFDPYSRK